MSPKKKDIYCHLFHVHSNKTTRFFLHPVFSLFLPLSFFLSHHLLLTVTAAKGGKGGAQLHPHVFHTYTKKKCFFKKNKIKKASFFLSYFKQNDCMRGIRECKKKKIKKWHTKVAHVLFFFIHVY
jgi:hypothetical protein